MLVDINLFINLIFFSLLQEQEDAYARKTEELKQKSEEGGLVSRNKAKNELAQHLGEDPLPLRRAKITTEAATKKVRINIISLMRNQRQRYLINDVSALV